MVNDLRKRTDLPMMECKAALQEANGDMEKAIDIIRVKVKGAGVKRAGNETAEGRIGVYIDNAAQVGAIVEMRCESAPVAKGEHFVKLANAVARVAATQEPGQPGSPARRHGRRRQVGVRPGHRHHRGPAREHEGAAVRPAPGRAVRRVRPPRRDARGAAPGERVGGQPGLLRDVCMHIAAVQPTPVAARRDEVPAAVIAKEKEIAKAKAEATGKPAQIAEKIAEGQMKTWFAENVLVEQPFVKDQAKTVGQVLQEAGLEVTKFVRYKVGEIPA